MKIGLIGCGKMGSALIQGVLAAKVCQFADILVYDRVLETAKTLGKESGVLVAAGNREVAKKTEIILLCVKPNDALAVLAEARVELEGKLLISIAAGVTIASLQKAAGQGCRIVRVMPNTPVLVRKGASAYALGEGVSQGNVSAMEQIFTSVGLVFSVEESFLDAVTGLSGSGPAYAYLFIEALAEGGVQMGLSHELAMELAVQTVAGAAEMVSQTKQHPAELRQMVTSPGGTTVAGLAALERGRLTDSLKDAVRAATLRSRELGSRHNQE